MSILTMQFHQFHIENLFFMDPVKNVIMKNGDFIKFLYSDEDCVMNSIYFDLPMVATGVEKYFHKNKLVYDVHHPANVALIKQMYFVEKTILDYFDCLGKKPVYKISENAYQGNIHFTCAVVPNEAATASGVEAAAPAAAVPQKIIIKFSGIWENATEYGITYKFIVL